MARCIKFKNSSQEQLYKEFLLFLERKIPVYRMPAKKYYTGFNIAIKKFVNEKLNMSIDSILDIVDYSTLVSIQDSLQTRFIFITNNDKKLEGIKYYIEFIKEHDERSESIPVSYIDITEEYKEGSLLDCHGSKYERNRKARQECLNYFGYSCRVCGFDFEKTYGEIGRNFIEVHHSREISSHQGIEHKVNPQKDLIPVCSNCHSMLHRTKPALSIEALQSLIVTPK